MMPFQLLLNLGDRELLYPSKQATFGGRMGCLRLETIWGNYLGAGSRFRLMPRAMVRVNPARFDATVQ